MANQDQSKKPQAGDAGKIGLLSDKQPGLVPPSGASDDKPMGGGSINLDDESMEHPRGNNARTGGTQQAQGGDSAPLGPPGEIMSDRNGPSDPGAKKQ